MKKRRLLLEEFKAGIWTREEYQKEVRDLDGRPAPPTTEPSTSGSNTSGSSGHSSSPPWQIEDEDQLPEEDDIYI
jgi:hypothetical protein